MITPRQRIAWLIRELGALDHELAGPRRANTLTVARYLATLMQELHELQVELVHPELIEVTAPNITTSNGQYIDPVEVPE